MHCASCVRRVENALTRVEGVESASVNLMAGRADVVTTNGVTQAQLEQAVSKIGFGAMKWTGESLERDRKEAETLRRDLWIAVALTVPVFALSMFWHPRPVWANWLLLALSTPVIFFSGSRFFVSAVKGLKNLNFTMDTLIAMGSFAAWAYSVAALFLYTGMAQSHHIYFETGAMIVTLLLVGRYIESNARQKSRETVRRLMERAPQTALVVKENGEEVERPVDAVQAGDLIRVVPGSRIPVDGVVEEGVSDVDESLLTGEPVPVTKQAGEKVASGSINTEGTFLYKATKVGAQSTLARIVQMVERAQSSKAPIQGLADRVSSIFVPIVIVLALATFAGWWFSGAGLERAFMIAVSVLVIACPCALGLATPSAIVSGTSRGAELGILIKDGPSLEQAGRIGTVLMDKTGTLTQGRLSVKSVIVAELDKAEVLRLAAAAEMRSEHPIAKAIVAAAGGAGSPEPEEFASKTGRGLRAVVDGREVQVGRPSYLEENDIDLTPLATELDKMQTEALTVVAVAVDGRPVGLIGLADTLAEQSQAAVEHLHRLGLRVGMITGDARANAQAVAQQLGIDDIEAEVLPEEKAARVERIQKERGVVAMVGDGVNDAPALAQADLGIAVQKGTDVAGEAADVVLTRDDLMAVPASIELSRATLRTVKWNLLWAFAYNTLMIPLAVAGLLNPMFAAGAMAFSSVFVVLNSLRLKRFHPQAQPASGTSS